MRTIALTTVLAAAALLAGRCEAQPTPKPVAGVILFKGEMPAGFPKTEAKKGIFHVEIPASDAGKHSFRGKPEVAGPDSFGT